VGTVVLQASQAANGNYSAGTQNATFTVSAEAPTITFNVANQTYGVAPFAVSATSNSAGTFTYSVVSGPATISGSTVTITGTGTVVLQASQAANGNYTAGTENASFTVNKAMPTLTWAAPSPITYGTALSATQLNATSGGVAGSMVYTPPAGFIPGVGSQILSVTFTPVDSTDYSSVTQTVSLTVTKGSVSINGTSSLPVSTYGDSVTITFTFIGGGDPPTGTTTIKDGAVTLGTVPLMSGTATLSTTTLSAGVHTLTAIYNGDGNYN
jgi:hypothetical protein